MSIGSKPHLIYSDHDERHHTKICIKIKWPIWLLQASISIGGMFESVIFPFLYTMLLHIVIGLAYQHRL